MYIESLSKSMANWMLYHNNTSKKAAEDEINSTAEAVLDPRQRLINSQRDELVSQRSDSNPVGRRSTGQLHSELVQGPRDVSKRLYRRG